MSGTEQKPFEWALNMYYAAVGGYEEEETPAGVYSPDVGWRLFFRGYRGTIRPDGEYVIEDPAPRPWEGSLR